MSGLRDYWMLSVQEQREIREANPGYADTEEDYQAFLCALFPPCASFDEANERYDLSDSGVSEQAY